MSSTSEMIDWRALRADFIDDATSRVVVSLLQSCSGQRTPLAPQASA